MRNIMLLAFLSIASCLFAPVRAEDAKPDAPKPDAPGEIIDVKDHEKIKTSEGQTVSVRGTVHEVFNPRSGSVKIFNYDGISRNDFNAIIKKDNFDAVNAGFNGDIDAAVKGKTVVVTGRVSLFKERPQVEITKPDQIKIEEGEAKKDDAKKEDEKKPEEKPDKYK